VFYNNLFAELPTQEKIESRLLKLNAKREGGGYFIFPEKFVFDGQTIGAKNKIF
jgi:hypothetical protein